VGLICMQLSMSCISAGWEVSLSKALGYSYHFLIEISWALILQKNPGSLNQQNEKLNTKPPLPNNTASQFRKGAYHESLDFVMSLCETSYGLVDVFPIEDRKSALCEVNAFLSFLFLTYRYYTHIWDLLSCPLFGQVS